MKLPKKIIPDTLSNADLEYLEIQRSKMETDVFPLDTLLPISSVLKFFRDEYNNVVASGGKFFSNKNQRLREGYFGMFVAVAKSKLENKEHLMVFPKNPNRDVDLLSIKEVNNGHPTLWNFPCDIKEYTQHSPSLKQFLEEKVVPRLELENYNIIIGVHVDIPNPQEVIDLLKHHAKKMTVWLVFNTSPNESDLTKSRVIMIFGDIVEHCDIDLSVEIPQIKDGEAVLIYQNTLRYKPTP